MNEIALHFVCPFCGALGVSREKRTAQCADCGLIFSDCTEEQLVSCEIEYYSRKFEQARESAIQISKAATLILAAIGFSTFVIEQMGSLFLAAALAYLILLAALFTRPSYRVDASFFAISQHLEDHEFVGSQLARIFRFTFKRYPWVKLEDRLAAASRLYRLLAHQK